MRKPWKILPKNHQTSMRNQSVINLIHPELISSSLNRWWFGNNSFTLADIVHFIMFNTEIVTSLVKYFQLIVLRNRIYFYFKELKIPPARYVLNVLVLFLRICGTFTQIRTNRSLRLQISFWATHGVFGFQNSILTSEIEWIA